MLGTGDTFDSAASSVGSDQDGRFIWHVIQT
ncbi:hypothetical protein HNQ07_004165 [Deinococcus metalli]|uniref:Uncharacterized protein n=1 Tax=Deinococcus metalli TaxID=1141878 RepID=A0A7W8KJ06_9DEIO|nr:hypothetical protein [Deinococcus metalli]